MKKTKPHKSPAPSNADHKEMVKKKRAIWRKQHNLCQDNRQVSGAGNMQLTLIPVANKQKLQHGIATATSTPTEDRKRQSTFVKQQKPCDNSTIGRSKNKSNGSSASFRIDLHSWQRDLTQEGIEPNPGPGRWDTHTTHPANLNSKSKKQLHNTHSFRVWQCNIRSLFTNDAISWKWQHEKTSTS